MLRVHFSLQDLARLRVVENAGPVLESVFALNLLSRGNGNGLREWRRQVRVVLGSLAPDVDKLVQQYRPVPDLFWVVSRDPDEREAASHTDAQERRRVAATVFDFCRLAVLPYWASVQAYLQKEREVRGRAMITHGVDGLLRTLHPRLTWKPPVLEIPHPKDQEIHLDGRGLSVKLSLFLLDGACMLLDPSSGTDAPTLVCSVAMFPDLTAILQNSSLEEEHALGALVGHTRAAALKIIAESCTTGQLSERLGISPAGASKHAKVLRKAGLVATARNRNSGLHTLTSLGVALLQNGGMAGRDESKGDVRGWHGSNGR